jgi:transcriptional regulator with XRE-family HTH domain
MTSERMRVEVGRDLRRARTGLDLSLADVGREVGLSRSQVARIELAQLRHVALEDLVSVSVVLGLDLSLRAFPGGAPLRDVAHLALLERLRAIVHPGLRWAVEVPVVSLDHGDRRAWDAMIQGDRWRIAVEAETRLRDAQDVERRVALKMRDGRVDQAILLLADTRWNRHVLRAAGPSLTGQFPLIASAVLAALRTGRDPGASGIVLL